jgi:hypothetical protein
MEELWLSGAPRNYTMRGEFEPFEVPWLATMYEGKLRLQDKARYDQWLLKQFGDGERAMIIVVPLVADTPAYHAAAFRYYRSFVLPIIAEAMGEANPEDAHEQVAGMFLPPKIKMKKGPKDTRPKIVLTRRSTSMTSIPARVFLDFLDRVVAWAAHPDGLNVEIHEPDKRWKWTAAQKNFERDAFKE